MDPSHLPERGKRFRSHHYQHFLRVLQERRYLGCNLFLVTDPNVTAARIANEARSRNMLSGKASAVECAEQIIGHADRERRHHDTFEIESL